MVAVDTLGLDEKARNVPKFVKFPDKLRVDEVPKLSRTLTPWGMTRLVSDEKAERERRPLVA